MSAGSGGSGGSVSGFGGSGTRDPSVANYNYNEGSGGSVYSSGGSGSCGGSGGSAAMANYLREFRDEYLSVRKRMHAARIRAAILRSTGLAT